MAKYQTDTWVYYKGPNNQYYQGLIQEDDYKDHLYKIEYFHDDGFVKNSYVLEKEILDFKFKNGEEIQFRCNVAWRRGKIVSSYADKDGQIFYDINPWDGMIKAYDALRGYKEIQEINVRKYTNYNKIPWECKDSIPVQFSLPPLQPKFKVGDKVIFTSKLNGDDTRGTITKILEKGSISIKNGDYVVKEYGSNSFWEVWEKDITGVWDECTLSMPTDHLDYFRYFPKFSFPTVSDGVLLGIDTDSIKVKNGEYIKVKKEDNMNNRPRNHKFVRTISKERKIKEVIFNGPATIIKWEPTMPDYANGKCKGDKTVSVCGVTDPYDKEKGFLLAVIKEFVDNQSYDNILRMMDSFNDEERK